jgi:FHA domain
MARLLGTAAPSPPLMMRFSLEPRLVLDAARPHARRDLVIRRPGPQSLGRGADCDLRINDPSLSRCHALLRYVGDRIVIEDLDSQEGTSVNGLPISQPTVLRHGDRVTLGSVDMELEIPAAAALPAVAYPDERYRSVTKFSIAEPHSAPTPERARRLLRWGVALMLTALGVWLAIAALPS